MKKFFMLSIITILSLTLTGCGEDVIETKICTKDKETYIETYELTATNDETNNVMLTILYNNSLFDVDTLEDLTDEQKEQTKENMLTSLGLEETTYEGFEINIDIAKLMTVNIKADLSLADPGILKKVGLNLDSVEHERSLKEIVEQFTNSGYTCEDKELEEFE